MNHTALPANPYLLLTPGPLTTTRTVKAAMLRDWCTWDEDYNAMIETLRRDLTALATRNTADYAAVLMQGSGTFSVESVIGGVIPKNGRLLVLTNGAYGDRIVQMAQVLGIDHIRQDSGETAAIDFEMLKKNLRDESITHVAAVHCETTTGMLNDIRRAARLSKAAGKVFIADAMSSFGGIPMDVSDWQIDFLISSANKCIQGVPGFGFVIARKAQLQKCKGYARSLSLDLYSQWEAMEKGSGKWRFTSPTHVVRAFCQAMEELKEEGGIPARHERYRQNQEQLTAGMRNLGFHTLLSQELQSPIITSFLYPHDIDFTFPNFYQTLKESGYVIYPGKISKADTFRIGNIGEVYPDDISGLLDEVKRFVRSRTLAQAAL